MSYKRNLLNAVTLVVLAGTFIMVALHMPPFGSPNRPVSEYYLYNALPETGALNVVAAVIWTYRGYDTLGEATVLFTAVLSTLIIYSRRIEK